MPFISICCLFVDNPLHKVLYMFILTLYKCVFSYTYIMVIDDLCKLAFFSSASSTKPLQNCYVRARRPWCLVTIQFARDILSIHSFHDCIIKLPIILYTLFYKPSSWVHLLFHIDIYTKLFYGPYFLSKHVRMFPSIIATVLIYLLDKLSYHLAFLFRLSILQSTVLPNVNMPLAVILHLLVFVLIMYIKTKRCISLVNIKSRCRHLVIKYIYL